VFDTRLYAAYAAVSAKGEWESALALLDRMLTMAGAP
jgi:hypothetical protein